MLRDVEIAPDMISALVACGWLHPSKARNREAVTAAIGAIVLRSQSAGVTPSQKALIEVDPAAVLDAAPWLRPGEQLSTENPRRVVGTVAKCARIAGFTPEVFAGRLNAMVSALDS